VKLDDLPGAPRRCPRCLISRHACWRRGCARANVEAAPWEEEHWIIRETSA
jgi:hypothetical protein